MTATERPDPPVSQPLVVVLGAGYPGEHVRTAIADSPPGDDETMDAVLRSLQVAGEPWRLIAALRQGEPGPVMTPARAGRIAVHRCLASGLLPFRPVLGALPEPPTRLGPDCRCAVVAVRGAVEAAEVTAAEVRPAPDATPGDLVALVDQAMDQLAGWSFAALVDLGDGALLGDATSREAARIAR